MRQDAFASNATVAGRWPKDLQGSLYRNGQAQHEIGDFRYQHWFHGDGMLQSFRFDENGMRHAARMIQTKKYLAEKAAGRALFSGFASVPPSPAAVTSLDLINPGNISVPHHHGKLLALWEAGSPWR